MSLSQQRREAGSAGPEQPPRSCGALKSCLQCEPPCPLVHHLCVHCSPEVFSWTESPLSFPTQSTAPAALTFPLHSRHLLGQWWNSISTRLGQSPPLGQPKQGLHIERVRMHRQAHMCMCVCTHTQVYTGNVHTRTCTQESTGIKTHGQGDEFCLALHFFRLPPTTHPEDPEFLT